MPSVAARVAQFNDDRPSGGNAGVPRFAPGIWMRFTTSSPSSRFTDWRAPGATGGKLASPMPVGRRHRQADLRIESDGRDPGDSVATGIMGLRPGRRR